LPVPDSAFAVAQKINGRIKHPALDRLMAHQAVLSAALRVHNDIGDDATGDGGENVLVIRPDPVIAARWFPQVIILPIRHNILVIAVLGRKPITTRPVGIVLDLVASITLIAVAALVLGIGALAPRLAAIAVLDLLLL
jgi:hypothetical protein